MRIGDFCIKHGIPVSTIRHYIDIKLLMPEKRGAHYSFSPAEDGEITMILKLKSCGFDLPDIAKYINADRLFNIHDQNYKTGKLHILEDVLQKRLNARKLLEEQIVAIRVMMQSLKEERDEMGSESKGFSFSFTELLACPECGGALGMKNMTVEANKFVSGDLKCKCGYCGRIDDGIVFTGIEHDYGTDEAFLMEYYGAVPGGGIRPESPVSLDLFEGSSAAYQNMIFRNAQWITAKANSLSPPAGSILYADISCQLFYRYHEEPFLRGALNIVAGLTEVEIRNIKCKMDELNTDLNILYIVNTNGRLPLKKGSLDLIVDFGGFFNLSFFQDDISIASMSSYLPAGGHIAGAFDYYDEQAESPSRANALYRNSIPGNLLFGTQKHRLDQCFDVRDSFVQEIQEDPGFYFDYHVAGDTRGSYCYTGVKKGT